MTFNHIDHNYIPLLHGEPQYDVYIYLSSGFFPVCVLKCLFKLSSREKFKSLWTLIAKIWFLTSMCSQVSF